MDVIYFTVFNFKTTIGQISLIEIKPTEILIFYIQFNCRQSYLYTSIELLFNVTIISSKNVRCFKTYKRKIIRLHNIF